MSRSRTIDVRQVEHSPWNLFGRFEAEVIKEGGTSGNGRSDYSPQRALQYAEQDAAAKEAAKCRNRR